MNISVVGWYNHRNVGDEAFRLAFPKMLPGHDLKFGGGLSDGDDPDALILGGGDVVSPNYTRHFKKFTHKPKIAASVTVTNNSDMDNLRSFDRVFVRDHRSLAIAQQHMGDDSRVGFLPDVTFLLEPDRDAGRDMIRGMFEAEGLDLYDKVVVIVISSYVSFNMDDALARDFITFLKVSQDISIASDNTPASFVFLPFCTGSPHDDRGSNAFVSSRSKFYKKNLVVYDRLGVQDTLNVVAAADAVVSTRFHGTVFATIAGVPFIDLTHHNKNLGFIETIGKTNWSIPLWEFSAGKFKGLLHDFLGNRSVPDGDLAGIASKYRSMLGSARLFDGVGI